MAKSQDSRRVIGAFVFAKVRVVTSDSECKRLFGALWKSATVNGTVKHVVVPPKGSRKHTSLIVDWTIRGSSKTKEVKLMNVRVREDVSVDSTIAGRSSIGVSSSNEDIRNESSAETTIRHIASENNGSVSPIQ